LDRGLLPYDYFGVGGTGRFRQRAGAASFGADSTALGWSSARVPPFTCDWMDRAAIVFILVGTNGAYMAATARHDPFSDHALLVRGNRNDNRGGHRIGGGNCDVLTTKVHSLVNECRSPVHHARSNAMAMLSCWLLASNRTSLALPD